MQDFTDRVMSGCGQLVNEPGALHDERFLELWMIATCRACLYAWLLLFRTGVGAWLLCRLGWLVFALAGLGFASEGAEGGLGVAA
jgi:hypothetical protein